MSTSYRFEPNISRKELFKAVDEIDGLDINVNNDGIAIVDSRQNYLWIDGEETVGLERYGASYADEIIKLLEEHLGIEVISEHDDRFWTDEDREGAE